MTLYVVPHHHRIDLAIYRLPRGVLQFTRVAADAMFGPDEIARIRLSFDGDKLVSVDEVYEPELDQ